MKKMIVSPVALAAARNLKSAFDSVDIGPIHIRGWGSVMIFWGIVVHLLANPELLGLIKKATTGVLV